MRDVRCAGKNVIIIELLMGNAVAQLCTIFGYARELDCGKHNDKPYGRQRLRLPSGLRELAAIRDFRSLY